MARPARKIGAFRTSGVNPRPEPPQQPAGTPVRSAPRAVPQRPADARTASEALEGLQHAAADPRPALVTPRFRSTSGPWIQLGAHQTRVPTDVAISTTRARDGRYIAVIAHLDQSDEPGKVQVLVDTTEGVRELLGLRPEQLRQLRETFFGR